MLHPTRAVAMPRDFKAEAEQIYNIYNTKIFLSKPLSGMICRSIQTNLKVLKTGG